MLTITAIGDSIVQSFDTGPLPYITETEQWLYRLMLAFGQTPTVTTLTPFNPDPGWSTAPDVSPDHRVLTGQDLTIINAGVGATEAVYMRDNFATNALGRSPDLLLVQSTANDISHGDVAAGVTEGYLAEIYDLADAAHVPVIAMLSTPRNNFTTAKKDKLDALNAWTRAEAASRGYALLDLFTPMESSPGSREMPAAYHEDGTHQSVAGCQAMADAAAAQLLLAASKASSIDLAWAFGTPPYLIERRTL